MGIAKITCGEFNSIGINRGVLWVRPHLIGVDLEDNLGACWVSVDAILWHLKMKWTLNDVWVVAQESHSVDRPRFHMESQSDVWYIRATHKHTNEKIQRLWILTNPAIARRLPEKAEKVELDVMD